MPEQDFKPINFNAPDNKADADKSTDDSAKEADADREPAARGILRDAETTDGEVSDVDPTKDPHLKEENKLPPANELSSKEEDPEQRKIAGEAPHITAARPDAFTKEVKGGVVKEENKPKKEGVITGDDKKSEEKPTTTSTPVLT